MNARAYHVSKVQQSGLSYVEVLIAVVLIMLALAPAMSSLSTAVMATHTQTESVRQYQALVSRVQELRMTVFSELHAAAESAGAATVASSFSDVTSNGDQRLVYLSLYDADDTDGDGDPFTILDANADGDSNPYTSDTGLSDISLLWLKVELAGSPYQITTLVTR